MIGLRRIAALAVVIFSFAAVGSAQAGWSGSGSGYRSHGYASSGHIRHSYVGHASYGGHARSTAHAVRVVHHPRHVTVKHVRHYNVQHNVQRVRYVQPTIFKRPTYHHASYGSSGCAARPRHCVC
jgi:hypothetical protein